MLHKVLLTVSLLSLSTFNALAHGGHDHSDPSAGLIHLLWVAPALIVGAIVSYKIRKKQLAKRNDK